MKFSAKQIAGIIQAEIEGNPEIEVDHLSKIEEGDKGALCFLANPKYTPYIYTTLASIVLVNKDFIAEKAVAATLLRVDNAYAAFAKLMEFYQQQIGQDKGVAASACIDSSAFIGSGASIDEFVFIGKDVRIGMNARIYPQVYIGNNVSIGDNVILYPGVKIYHNCVLGNNCTLHAGVVIGSDGFGFAPVSDGTYDKIPQLGNVVIEDSVEIGSNTVVDRATLGSTFIRKGVKLDNLVQIGHNAEIGENTVIAGQSGIAGTARIGKNCLLGGQVGISGHITIADNVKIGGQAGIEGNITQEGITLLGSPALEIRNYKRSFIHFKNLEKLAARIDELEKKLGKT
ncbi:MAG: UDP-3-O-(3-hydroxymyristoyl)glucosamine N-acyltransferase [Bacteroidales bacterium]